MRKFMLNSLGRLDLICWLLVILFFFTCACLFGGNPSKALMAAVGVVLVMILISLAIEVIIEALQDVKGLGTITGFITNGPELVCLVVGLAVGDVLFAASTPLGSNFMNPILLAAAALVSRMFVPTLTVCWKYCLSCIFLTMGLASSFYAVPESGLGWWLGAAVAITCLLFVLRPKETISDSQDEAVIPMWVLGPAILVLTGAGFLLDPVVSFASAQSHAPKGVIGFFVLATLSSWPEFKCCLSLLRRKKTLAAVLNITVSNIMNIWLACAGLFTYLIC